MTIRLIRAGDLPELIELRGTTRENPFPREALRRRGITEESLAALLRSTHRGWLGESGGRIAGFAIGDGTSGELTVIAVRSEFEGRGLGARLLSAVEAWLAKKGHAEAWLWTSADPATRAYGFYGHHGWTMTETKKDVATFRKRLPPGPAFMIRPARPEDAGAACAVLRRSIVECCAVDHRHDPEILESWLGNKTPETVRSWLAGPSHAVVAEQDGLIVGVALLSGAGKVTLNYLVPEARGRGIGKAMLELLEVEAIRRGGLELTLTSTLTAHDFYLAQGYADTGKISSLFGLTSPEMRKVLSPR